jgi:capsid portal protein
MPNAIIILEGEWEEGAEETVKQFINREITGAENAHKTLIIRQPDTQNSKFIYTPLGTQTKKDSTFRLYAQDRRDAILTAHSMPPERVGIRVVGKLGGNVAEEATRIYVQSVVEPLQLDMEEMINDKLLQSEIYEFKFVDIDLRNEDAEVDRSVKQIQNATMTPNEARKSLGQEEYPEGDKFYVASNLVEVGGPDE